MKFKHHRKKSIQIHPRTPHPKALITLPAFMPSHNGCNATHPFALGANAEILPQRGPLHSTGIIPFVKLTPFAGHYTSCKSNGSVNCEY
jgi:hypothetical protein